MTFARLDAALRPRLLGLVVILQLASFGGPQAATPSAPLFSSSNGRYGLVLDFFGDWVGPDSDPKGQFLIDHLALRNLVSGESTEYRPEDAETLRDSMGFYRDVWSPDGDYLVVPRGRFEGFAICEANRGIQALTAAGCSDSIAIRYNTRPLSVWHGFGGWSGEHVLLFNATIENTSVLFSYDLKKKVISAVSSPIDALDAVNAFGAVAVFWRGQARDNGPGSRSFSGN